MIKTMAGKGEVVSTDRPTRALIYAFLMFDVVISITTCVICLLP